MKKALLLTFFITGSLLAHAQKPVFSGSLFATPSTSFRTLNAQQKSGKEYTLATLEEKAMIVEGGGRINMDFRKDWRLSAGAVYSSRRFDQQIPVYARNGDIIGTKFGYTSIKQIEIPLLVSYHFMFKSLRLSAVGGISNGYLKAVEYHVPANKMSSPGRAIYSLTGSELKGYNLYQPSILLGAELSVPASPHVNFFFQPNMKYGLRSLSQDKSMEKHLYTYGLSFGIDYFIR